MTLQSILLAIAALALVLGLIWLARFAVQWGGLAGGARPRRGGDDSGRLALVQVLALDPRRRLHLIRCDTRHVLVLTGGTQDQVVGWLDRAEP